MTQAIRQLCTFYVDGLFVGVEVQGVQEVIRYQAMTRVPRAAAGVEGLINLRGQIVTAIDLRHRLRLSPRPAELLPMNVVIRSDDGAVSLLVDEIGDVLEAREDVFEDSPETLDPAVRRFIRGVYKLEHELLLLLDTEAVVNLVGAA